MKLPKKKIYLLICSLFLLALAGFCLLLFQVQEIRAQVPEPYVPCNRTSGTAYHSLRPYQASPCDQNVSETATFCGNQLILKEKVNRSEGTCVSLPGGGGQECTVTKSRNIAIDLSGAKLPILGNTEDVINSQQQARDIDNAEKTNEYLSWYLNGTSYRAEYPFPDIGSMDEVVDYAGPLRKLLPQTIQNRARIETIQKARTERHDQIVACTYGIPISVLGFIEVARIGHFPLPCYDDSLASFIANVSNIRNELRLSDWDDHLPPLEEEIGTKYEDFKDYWIAYKRWRGDSCAVVSPPDWVPLVGGKKFYFCFDNPLKPNYWSNLFPYIPLSSTEDRVGLVETTNVGVQPVSEGVEITNVSFSNQQPATLFFAHTQEAAELASLLQSTYLPLGIESVTAESGVAASTSTCDLVNIRTSSGGDDLFAGEISGTLTYTAKFNCSPANACEAAGGKCYDADTCAEVSQSSLKIKDNSGCQSGKVCCTASASGCEKELYVGLSIQTKTPKADEIWSRTVAGSSAVFKRIAPQLGPDSDLGCLLDIPAASRVNYSSTDGNTDIVAGNPANERSGGSAEIYFPHIGGVSEYFLKGIQTILRPQGFGEPIIFGPPGDPLCSLALSTDICTKECNPNPTSVDMSGVEARFRSLANGWLGVGTPRIDKYNQVVNASIAAGVDPIFTLAIWLHETGASNYAGICQVLGGGDPSAGYCQRAQDFGINLADAETIYDSSGRVIRDNFDRQLRGFLYLPSYYLSICDLNSAKCPLEIFGAKYLVGTTCSASPESNLYIAWIKEIYRSLNRSQTFPCYPSKLP